MTSKARQLANVISGTATLPSSSIADGTITSAKLASGAAVSNIGFTPANKAGDTFTGNVNIAGAVAATGNVTAFTTL
jgi:hypothetical protein